MKIINIFLICFLATCLSCKSPGPKPKYTVKVQIVDATNNTVAANTPVQVVVSNVLKKYAILGSTTTNNMGSFNITYEQTDVTGNGALVYVQSDFCNSSIGAPNQNINTNVYISDSGTLKVYLETTKPLETNHDTLFLAFNITGGTWQVDTIFHTFNGLYKSFRVPHYPNQDIYWGRDWNDFNTNFRKTNKHFLFKDISGDPYTDSLTVNY